MTDHDPYQVTRLRAESDERERRRSRPRRPRPLAPPAMPTDPLCRDVVTALRPDTVRSRSAANKGPMRDVTEALDVLYFAGLVHVVAEGRIPAKTLVALTPDGEQA